MFRTYDNGAQLAMVRAGMGWAVMPLLAVDTRDPAIDIRPLRPAVAAAPGLPRVAPRPHAVAASPPAWSTSPATLPATSVASSPRSPDRPCASIVYGAGAVGGVVGGRMFQHGHDVVLVARGAHARGHRRPRA